MRGDEFFLFDVSCYLWLAAAQRNSAQRHEQAKYLTRRGVGDEDRRDRTRGHVWHERTTPTPVNNVRRRTATATVGPLGHNGQHTAHITRISHSDCGAGDGLPTALVREWSQYGA